MNIVCSSKLDADFRRVRTVAILHAKQKRIDSSLRKFALQHHRENFSYLDRLKLWIVISPFKWGFNHRKESHTQFKHASELIVVAHNRIQCSILSESRKVAPSLLS